jgi:hypothetical protein
VNFLKDILPYYLPCITFLAQLALYYFANGNIMWGLFAAYMINFPYLKSSAKLPQQETNLDKHSEKIFKEDKRFMGPLYLYVLLDTLVWIWCLCVVSGVYPSFLP